jgi:hypothetical protein
MSLDYVELTSFADVWVPEQETIEVWVNPDRIALPQADQQSSAAHEQG